MRSRPDVQELPHPVLDDLPALVEAPELHTASISASRRAARPCVGDRRGVDGKQFLAQVQTGATHRRHVALPRRFYRLPAVVCLIGAIGDDREDCVFGVGRHEPREIAGVCRPFGLGEESLESQPLVYDA